MAERIYFGGSTKVVMNPATNMPTQISTHILSGWKDIASYLGKGVRTVQRYEEDMRLPVRRPAGKARASVVATKTELDAWIAASPVRKESQLATASDPRCARSMAAVKQGIEEMHTLGEQMQGLRAEISRSLFLLQANILALQGEVRGEQSTMRNPFAESISVSSAALNLIGEFALPKAS